MPEIVTLAEAKEYIRVDGDHDDATIATLIAAATEAVLEVADTWDPETEVPARLKLAVLVRVAGSYDNREEAPAAKNEASLILPFSSFPMGATDCEGA